MAVGTLILDPAEVAIADRKEVDLEKEGLKIRKDPGPDYGDAAIKAFIAERDFGAAMIDYTLPPRKITIPLVVQGSAAGGNFDNLRVMLQAKCSRINEEGGWLKRKMPSGKIVYADLFEATLHLSSNWFTEHREVDLEAMLEFQAMPDLYGAPVVLASFEGTGSASQVSQILGNLPGRVDFTVTEQAAKNQSGLAFHFRCRNYSAAATAKSLYEAEALTPLDLAAEIASPSGAGIVLGGGKTVRHPKVGTNWVSMLSTNLKAGTYLTHRGFYNVWARVYKPSEEAFFRLLYDVGDLNGLTPNPQVEVPGVPGNLYWINLGQVNLREGPYGTHRWQGVIQARTGEPKGSAYIDQLYFQNTDESSGVITGAPTPPLPALAPYLMRDEFTGFTGNITGKTADVGGVWAEALNSDTSDFLSEEVPAHIRRLAVSDTGTIGTGGAFPGRAVGTPVEATNLVMRSDFILESAAPVSIATGHMLSYVSNAAFVMVQLEWNSSFKFWTIKAYNAAGTVLKGSNRPVKQLAAAPEPTIGSLLSVIEGERLTLFVAGADGEFGEVLSLENVLVGVKGKAFLYDENASATAATRVYDNVGIWTPEPDAVMFASRDMKLSDKGIYRRSNDGVGYGPVNRPGADLPRIPVSGPEERPVEIFVKGSRGDFGDAPDFGIDPLKGQMTYRPCWSEVPGV